MLGSLILGVAFAAPPVTITLPPGQAEVWAGAIALHDVQLIEDHAATVRLVDLGTRWELTVRGADGPVRRVVSEPRTDAAREDLLSLARTLMRQVDAPQLSRPSLPELPDLPRIQSPPIHVERASVRASASSLGGASRRAIIPPEPTKEDDLRALPSVQPLRPRRVTLSDAGVLGPSPASTFRDPWETPRQSVFVETGLYVASASRATLDRVSGVGLSGGLRWGVMTARASLLITPPATTKTLEEGSTLREREVGLHAGLRPMPWPVNLGVRAVASDRRFALNDQTIDAHWQTAFGPSLTVTPRIWSNVHLRGAVSGQRDLWRTILHVDDVASGRLRPWRWVVQVGVVHSTLVRRETKVAHE
ncbi:MAG: hypothetical protein ACI9MC_001280 [Kiritimatiellia bacterium]|jgi:hypothetical protein